MAEIKPFPLSHRTLTVDQTYDEAKKMNFDRVVVIGLKESEGNIFLCSEMTVAEALWFIERTKKMLLSDANE